MGGIGSGVFWRLHFYKKFRNITDIHGLFQVVAGCFVEPVAVIVNESYEAGVPFLPADVPKPPSYFKVKPRAVDRAVCRAVKHFAQVVLVGAGGSDRNGRDDEYRRRFVDKDKRLCDCWLRCVCPARGGGERLRGCGCGDRRSGLCGCGTRRLGDDAVDRVRVQRRDGWCG